MDFRGLVWKRVRKSTLFGLKSGQDLKNQAAHPHQEFQRVRREPSSLRRGMGPRLGSLRSPIFAASPRFMTLSPLRMLVSYWKWARCMVKTKDKHNYVAWCTQLLERRLDQSRGLRVISVTLHKIIQTFDRLFTVSYFSTKSSRSSSSSA